MTEGFGFHYDSDLLGGELKLSVAIFGNKKLSHDNDSVSYSF
ncbi:MAG: hypothetical protein WC313_01390 [Candidatus Kapaibacterium sp.]